MRIDLQNGSTVLTTGETGRRRAPARAFPETDGRDLSPGRLSVDTSRPGGRSDASFLSARRLSFTARICAFMHVVNKPLMAGTEAKNDP